MRKEGGREGGEERRKEEGGRREEGGGEEGGRGRGKNINKVAFLFYISNRIEHNKIVYINLNCSSSPINRRRFLICEEVSVFVTGDIVNRFEGVV